MKNKQNEIIEQSLIEAGKNFIIEDSPRPVSQFMWCGKEAIIPLDNINHIEIVQTEYGKNNNMIRIVFKGSKFNNETQTFEPNVYLYNEETDAFMKDYRIYLPLLQERKK